MGGIERFGLPKQGGVPASQAVKADGWLFVAGQVPKYAVGEVVGGGIAEQARQTLDILMKTLRQAGYGPEDVQAVIDGKAPVRKPAPERPRPAPRRVDLVIDIQERMRQGKGPAHERWAKVYNLKQMAAALQYLREKD